MSAIQNALNELGKALYITGPTSMGATQHIREAIQALQSLEGEAEKEAEELIIQRDYWEEKATELAMAVGEHFDVDVGEHSSDNCPVITAIDYMANHTTPQPPAVPDGYVMVPIEPTEEMISEAIDAGRIDEDDVVNIWQSMLSVSRPQSPVVAQVVEQMLIAVRDVLQRAYNSAEPVCCGRAGDECCGSPDPDWSEYDQKIMNDLEPVEKWLSAMLTAAQQEGDDS